MRVIGYQLPVIEGLLEEEFGQNGLVRGRSFKEFNYLLLIELAKPLEIGYYFGEERSLFVCETSNVLVRFMKEYVDGDGQVLLNYAYAEDYLANLSLLASIYISI